MKTTVHSEGIHILRIKCPSFWAGSVPEAGNAPKRPPVLARFSPHPARRIMLDPPFAYSQGLSICGVAPLVALPLMLLDTQTIKLEDLVPPRAAARPPRSPPSLAPLPASKFERGSWSREGRLSPPPASPWGRKSGGEPGPLALGPWPPWPLAPPGPMVLCERVLCERVRPILPVCVFDHAIRVLFGCTVGARASPSCTKDLPERAQTRARTS